MKRTNLSRRITGALAATALVAMGVVGLAGTAAAAATPACNPFPDVTASNIHCDNIAWLKKQGITKPADGQFHPTEVVTRGQMAAFLFRLLNPGESEPQRGYLPYEVYYGRMAPTPGGTPTLGADADGDLQPDAPVTRAAMATILHTDSTGYGWTVACHLFGPYRDVPSDSPHCADIAWAKDVGITFGVGDGKFSPDALVTRSQMATFQHRLSDYGLEHNRIRIEAGSKPATVTVRQGSQRDSYTLAAGEAVTVRPDPNDGAVTITRRGAEPVTLHVTPQGRLLPDMPLTADSGWTAEFTTGHHATTVELAVTGVGPSR